MESGFFFPLPKPLTFSVVHCYISQLMILLPEFPFIPSDLAYGFSIFDC